MKIADRTTQIFLTGTYEGAEINVKLNPPVGPLLDALENFQKADKNDLSQVMPTVWEMIRQLVSSWNFETKDGVEIPVTIEGLRMLPADLVFEIATKTQEAVISLPKVLRENSATL